MFAEERRNEILKLLLKKPDITVDELSKIFKITSPTVYKDLKILEKKKQLKKVYGGVKIINPELDKGFYDFFKRLEENSSVKRALAREAAKLISDGDVIALDSSTTVNYIIEELKTENEKNITILTNSATIIRDDILLNKENINIFSVGGILEKKTACFLEINPKILLPNLIANKFFFSTYGFSINKGVTDSFLPQNTSIKRAFFDMAQASFCLISSDKFGINGAMNWANLEEIKTIITDENVDPDILNYLNLYKIRVIIAKL